MMERNSAYRSSELDHASLSYPALILWDMYAEIGYVKIVDLVI